MWGIVPDAGLGSRIQPLAFSKELLPVGSVRDGDRERPRAVSEYLLERMVRGGARNICVVISPGKSDIVEYYGGRQGPAHLCYVVQPEPTGLCDSIFRALPLIDRDDEVLVGLPDTVWFPEDGFRALDHAAVSLLLFPVDTPELFDAVSCDVSGKVRRVHVKEPSPPTEWIWGAFKLTGQALHELHALWRARGESDVYFGTLFNAYLEGGGQVRATRGGQLYVDVGTVNGYRKAQQLLSGR